MSQIYTLSPVPGVLLSAYMAAQALRKPDPNRKARIEARKRRIEQDKQRGVGRFDQPYIRVGEKPCRNAPCPCGSGAKWKKCHGQEV